MNNTVLSDITNQQNSDIIAFPKLQSGKRPKLQSGKRPKLHSFDLLNSCAFIFNHLAKKETKIQRVKGLMF